MSNRLIIPLLWLGLTITGCAPHTAQITAPAIPFTPDSARIQLEVSRGYEAPPVFDLNKVLSPELVQGKSAFYAFIAISFVSGLIVPIFLAAFFIWLSSLKILTKCPGLRGNEG